MIYTDIGREIEYPLSAKFMQIVYSSRWPKARKNIFVQSWKYKALQIFFYKSTHAKKRFRSRAENALRCCYRYSCKYMSKRDDIKSLTQFIDCKIDRQIAVKKVVSSDGRNIEPLFLIVMKACDVS